MTIESGTVRSGLGRIAPGAVLGLAVAVASLTAATVCTRAADAGESARQALADDSASASAVLTAVRGESPLACSLTSRTLENRWGTSHHLGGPDAAVLDAPQAAAYDWDMTDRTPGNALGVLRRAMSDPDACVRRTAAQLVGRTDDKDLADQLRSELGSSDATRRETAVLALGYWAESAAEPALAQAAGDGEPRVRRTTAWALGRSRSAAAAPTLLRMLRDLDAMVRVNAALSLGALSAASAVAPLSDLLSSDSDARVRRAAAAALGQMDKNRSKP